MNGPSPLPEPPPRGGGDRVLDLAIDFLRQRAEFGREKYGQYLQVGDGRDTLVDLVQELGDAFKYAMKLHREAPSTASGKFVNDAATVYLEAIRLYQNRENRP